MKTQSLFEELRFDADKHQYWIAKKRIPGVSEILKKVGLVKDYEGIDPFYRDRGKATHKAIELHLKGILDRSSLDPAVEPCFAAFLNYQSHHDLGKIIALEKPMCNLSETFAGTADLITDKAIFDWKCSKSHDKVADLQGQAYKHLVLDNWLNLKLPAKDFGGLPSPFIVVELHDDGTYAEFNYGSQYEQWSSVLDLWRWRIGKNEKEGN